MTLNSSIQQHQLNYSQQIFERAKAYLKSKNSLDFAQELSTIDPNASSCSWLQGDSIDRAGLGHTLASFVKYLQDAVQNSLTYHSSFFTTAHNLCDIHETIYFFGFHTVFLHARSPSPRAKYVDVGKGTKGCTSESITREVSAYRSTHGPFNCINGDIVFKCHNKDEPFQKRISSNIKDVANILRSVFSSAYQVHRSKHIHPSLQRILESKNTTTHCPLIITTHIRRGDIFHGKRVDKEHRLVSYQVYVTILRRLLLLNRTPPSHMRHCTHYNIQIFILCEGSTDNQTIADYFEHNVRQTKYVNINQEMQPYCNRTNDCTVEVLWDADFYESFVVMCETDVLITSTSGFAWSAAVLCNPPLTLAFPWGSTYEEVDNVVEVKAHSPLWLSTAKIGLPRLHSAWDRMLRRLASVKS